MGRHLWVRVHCSHAGSAGAVVSITTISFASMVRVLKSRVPYPVARVLSTFVCGIIYCVMHRNLYVVDRIFYVV